MVQHKKVLLGEALPKLVRFANVEGLLTKFSENEFRSMPSRVKFKAVCEAVLAKIQEAQAPCFLLAALLEVVGEINARKITDEPFSLDQFEIWLNHWSGLSSEENLKVRGKIVGRYIPRDDYQVYFPIGMGKMFSGSHFVAAHLSPDVDTTMSSFWGWVDALGCRVAVGNHQWSLPSGLSDGHIQLFLKRLFGDEFFDVVPREMQTVTSCAQDLLTKRKFFKVASHQGLASLDLLTEEHAIIIVDERGMYLGEWRSTDAEVIGQIMASFFTLLRWFASRCYSRFINTLAQKVLSDEDIARATDEVLCLSMRSCPAISELPEKARTFVDTYMKRVIGLHKGLEDTFKELFLQLDKKLKAAFHVFIEKCLHISTENALAQEGNLQGDRIEVARLIEVAIGAMEEALDSVKSKISTLSHVLEIKERVLEISSAFVTLKSDVDEMRSKIGNLDHLCVVTQDRSGSWYPIGVVYAEELRKPSLGTASLRDFSSLEETKMASYIDVVSIVDHHKTKVVTSAPSTLVVGDVQSSNTLLGEISLSLNCTYGNSRTTELRRRRESLQEGYFVDASRELSEYFSYIYAILDDTDLLTKVTKRDVLCVQGLLNRMRSLVDGSEVQAVRFDHISQNDVNFVKKAAKLLLQSEDLHSIYLPMYEYKEREVEGAIHALIEGRVSSFFLDTKEQNGCCRVGQAKLFLKNLPTFEPHRLSILHSWQKDCNTVNQARAHIDFFLQMTSTITSAEEVFHGQETQWNHSDEMWLWSPDDGVAQQHLVWFLNSFQSSPTAHEVPMTVEVMGPQAKARALLCKQNFPIARACTVQERKDGPTILIFRFPAGKINSRKSQIAPYLPRVVT